ncbi:class I SAM-dependent methyltransferase family protein [Salmonella enterica subsp. enterica]|nr:class I SAM-dependent methyltransferase family protein [Salmonella enterica subsp. enterica]
MLEDEVTVSDILLRDFSELNVARGQEMIASRGMSSRVRFERGDAFTRRTGGAETTSDISIVLWSL